LLEKIGIHLSNGAGTPEIVRFPEHIREYNIIFNHGLSRDNIMFEVQVDSSKILNILYDYVEREYHVIA